MTLWGCVFNAVGERENKVPLHTNLTFKWKHASLIIWKTPDFKEIQIQRLSHVFACVQRPPQAHLCRLSPVLDVKRLQIRRWCSGHLKSILHPKTPGHGWGNKPEGRENKRYLRPACDCTYIWMHCITTHLATQQLKNIRLKHCYKPANKPAFIS